MNWNDLADTIRLFENVNFAGGADEITIDKASAEIGLPFSPEYRLFLSQLGSGGGESSDQRTAQWKPVFEF